LFTLVHGTRDVQFRAALMAEFFGEQGLGDNTDDFSTSLQRGIRDHTHDADIAPAINDTDPLPCQISGKVSGGGLEDRIESATGPAVNGNAHGLSLRRTSVAVKREKVADQAENLQNTTSNESRPDAWG
jgi:hypothetical protein